MLERVVFLILAILVPVIAACSTVETRDYEPGSIPIPDEDHRIVAVTKSSGERVSFDGPIIGRQVSLPRVENEQIVGQVTGQPVAVPLSEASMVSVEEKRLQYERTVLLVGGVVFTTMLAVSISTGWGWSSASR